MPQISQEPLGSVLQLPVKTKLPNIKTKTLAELGPMLPLGSTPSARAIEVKPWRMKEERELGDIKDRHKDANVATFVAMILGHMCPVLGQPFEGLKEIERRAIVGQMWMGDVFYAYCWLRREAMGNIVELKMTCANCRTKFPFSADLDSLDIDCADSLEDAQWEYRLKKPVQMRGKTLEGFLMGPMRWNSLEMVKLGSSVGQAKPTLIRGAIHKIIGAGLEDTIIADHELDELSKLDVEHLSTLVDRYSIGPNMSVEGACPQCGVEFKSSLDWGFGSFFSTSSP